MEATRSVATAWIDETDNGQALYDDARALVERFTAEAE